MDTFISAIRNLIPPGISYIGDEYSLSEVATGTAYPFFVFAFASFLAIRLTIFIIRVLRSCFA